MEDGEHSGSSVVAMSDAPCSDRLSAASLVGLKLIRANKSVAIPHTGIQEVSATD